MYYYDEVVTDIEDLLIDFLNYRKSKKITTLAKVSEEEIRECNHCVKFGNNLETKEMPTEPVIPEPTYDIPKEKKLIDKFPNPLDMLPPDIAENMDDEYMHHLMGEVSKTLMPYVMEVLNSYEYTGSPIFDEQIDKETIAQIIDKVLEEAQKDIPEIDEIQTEPERQTWVRYRLLRAVAEVLVLSELFLRRRPVYRKVEIDSL